MKKITMSGISVCFVLVMVVLNQVEVTEAVTCGITQLSPCLGAVQTGQAPSGECCSKLREQKPCFCGYLKDPNLSKYVNSPNVKKVASTCGVSLPKC